MEYRKITLLTFAEHPDQGKKCWISLSGYNISRTYLENVILATYLPTRPEYNHVEIRADELLNFLGEIDQKSKSVIRSWNVKYFTMNQILNSKI